MLKLTSGILGNLDPTCATDGPPVTLASSTVSPPNTDHLGVIDPLAVSSKPCTRCWPARTTAAPEPAPTATRALTLSMRNKAPVRLRWPSNRFHLVPSL